VAHDGLDARVFLLTQSSIGYIYLFNILRFFFVELEMDKVGGVCREIDFLQIQLPQPSIMLGVVVVF
jgi:hypothetical protein